MKPYSVRKSAESKPVVIRPMSSSERQASIQREEANMPKKKKKGGKKY